MNHEGPRGVDTTWLTLSTASGPMRVYQAQPRPVQASAAVLVLQEAFGVNAHIQDVTRRLAADGYLAVAPDLFHRTEPGVLDYGDYATAMARIAELGPAQIGEDLAAVLAHLDETERITAGRTSVLGFCFGGRAAFTAAVLVPGLASTISFYGPGIVSGPHAVLGQTARITGPVMLLAGDQDSAVPAADIEAIRQAATRAGVDLRVRVFSGAGHAFHCDARPDSYHREAALEAWQDALSFLAQTLPGGSHQGGRPALAGVPLLDHAELAPTLRERLQPRIDRLGYLGDFFRLAAHQPEMLAGFIDFTEAGRQALPPEIAETVALSVATITRNDYERHQHEQLAVKLGFAKEWIERIERIDPDNDLPAGPRAVQAWIVAALDGYGHGSHEALVELVSALGPATAVGVVLLTGRYLAHATLVNSFGVRPPVSSVF
jgi:carboxymethylenebutenolidase